MAGLGKTLSEKQRVFQALALRFIIGRYGRENIGFMWIIAEPMLLCLGVMTVWSFTKGHGEHGVSIVAFVFTGYMLLTLWRHMTATVKLLFAFKFLTIFRGLTLLDALMSKMVLELISVTAAAVVVYGLLYFFGLVELPYDTSLMLQGWFTMGALGFGTGIFVAALSEMTDIIERVYQQFQYLTLPFSGCFFMVGWMPESAREPVQYVPLVHCYEMVRAGYFGAEVPTYYDPFYPLAWAIILAGLGFTLFERVKDHIEA